MIENLMTGLVIASAVGASLLYWLAPWISKWKVRAGAAHAKTRFGGAISLSQLSAAPPQAGCAVGCKDCRSGCGR